MMKKIIKFPYIPEQHPIQILFDLVAQFTTQPSKRHIWYASVKKCVSINEDLEL